MRQERLSNKLAIDRNAIGVINIGLRYLKSDGRDMTPPLTEPREVLVKLVTPHRGLTLLTELETP